MPSAPPMHIALTVRLHLREEDGGLELVGRGEGCHSDGRQPVDVGPGPRKLFLLVQKHSPQVGVLERAEAQVRGGLWCRRLPAIQRGKEERGADRGLAA